MGVLYKMLNFTTSKLLLNRPNSKIDGSIISIQQINIILAVCDNLISQNIDGDIVEFGCYVGESSKYLRMILDHYCSDKNLYVYDSFEGLPPLSKYEEHTSWKSGTLKTTEDILVSNFISNGLKVPIITKGWFKNIQENQLPNKICFGFLDGDFYDSIFDSLSLVYPKLSTGGCIIFHDYERPDLPGVKAAVEDYIAKIDNDSFVLYKIYDQLGVLIKS
jgi:O-methyltransferase